MAKKNSNVISWNGFSYFSLLENIPKKISSLACWNNNLFIGTNDGVLLVYEINYSKKHRFTTQQIPEKIQKNFSKKSVQQLCPIPELGLLISLSDQKIRLHTLSSLREVSVLKNSKDQPLKLCTSFALKKKNEEFKLVVAFKKKILNIFKYDSKHMTFVFESEMIIPDIAISLIWSGEKICVGFKNLNYYLLTLDGSTQPKAIFNNTSANQSMTLSSCLPTEIILIRDTVGIPLSFEGKAIRQHGINFSDFPTTLTYLNPFLIATMNGGNYIEAKLLSSDVHNQDNCIQMIPLQNISVVSQPNFTDLDKKKMDEGMGVSYIDKKYTVDKNDDILPNYRLFLASKNSVYVLTMNQVSNQAHELQKQKEFEKALELCNIFEGSPYEVIHQKVSDIHLEYGFHLFSNGDYISAMEHFSLTNSNPKNIILLYSDLVPKPLKGLEEEQKKKIEILMKDEKERKKSILALIPFLNTRRVPIVNHNPNLKRQDGKFEKIDDLTKQIGEAVDTALIKSMLIVNDEYFETFIKLENRCNVKDTAAFFEKKKEFNQLVFFYRVKDLNNDALTLLERLGKQTEGAGRSYDSLKGVLPTIKYLQELPNKDKDLIFKFAKWVLETNPVVGIEIFCHENCPFAPIKVLDYFDSLKSIFKTTIKIGYCENLIDNGCTDKEIHNILVELYFDYLTTENIEKIENIEGGKFKQIDLDEDDEDEEDNVNDSDSDDDMDLEKEEKEKEKMKKIKKKLRLEKFVKKIWTVKAVRKRLLQFLEFSNDYVPQKFIKLTNQANKKFYYEKAILLSKINRHESALEIYVNKLQKPEMAEEYCVKHFQKDVEPSNNIFILLLKLYLKKKTKSNIKEAIRIMENHYDRFEVTEVMKLLPDDLLLNDLSKFFESVIKFNLKQYRSLQVMKNLYKSENLDVNVDYINERKRSVKIKGSRMCPVCYRKIGHSAFACYPNGRVVHYGCTKQSISIDPISQKNFKDVFQI